MKRYRIIIGCFFVLTLIFLNCKESKPPVEPTPIPVPSVEKAEPKETPEPPKRPVAFYKDEKGFCALAVNIKNGLVPSIQKVLPESEPYAENIAAQIIKALFWEFDHRRDVRNGDTCRLVYKSTRDRFKIRVYGIRYRSLKHEKTYQAYFFWERDKKFPEYFNEAGASLAKKIKNCPLQHYDEVISLFRKGSTTNRGIKFRVKTGMQVTMPFPSAVTRINWDMPVDGLGVEVRYLGTGLLAQFVHLSAISSDVAEGHTVSVGSIFARTGISGKTQIPHLEYRLLKETDDGLIGVDPLEFHKTETYNLPPSAHTDLVSVKHQVLTMILKVGFESGTAKISLPEG